MGFVDKESKECCPSQTLKISLHKREIKQISGIIYEQVSCHGYPNMPMALDLLQPQQEAPQPEPSSDWHAIGDRFPSTARRISPTG